MFSEESTVRNQSVQIGLWLGCKKSYREKKKKRNKIRNIQQTEHQNLGGTK